MKYKIGFFPDYFEYASFALCLDDRLFEKTFIKNPDDIQVKFDVIFSYLDNNEGQLQFLEKQQQAFKFGFELGWCWTPHRYPMRELYNAIEKFDVVCSWAEHVGIIVKALEKKVWEFPQIFYHKIQGQFDKKRRNGAIHGINQFIDDVYSTTFGFLDCYRLGDFYFSLGLNKENFESWNITFDWLYPHENWEYSEYLNFLSNCSFMFQYTLLPSWGQAIEEAAMVGIPSVASPHWYQQILYPDLIIHNLKDAHKILTQDYELFQPHVDKAQEIFQYYNRDNPKCIKEYNNYIISLIET